MRHLLLPLVLASLAAAATAQAQSLELRGAHGQTAIVSAETLATLPRVTIQFSAHGVSHVYEGPLLIDVLKAVDVPTGRDLRGPALAFVVLATAADGYQVAYSLAEADPGTRPNRIILADRADGEPLRTEAGPFQIVVEGDLRPARSIRQVVALDVRSLSTSTDVGAVH